MMKPKKAKKALEKLTTLELVHMYPLAHDSIYRDLIEDVLEERTGIWVQPPPTQTSDLKIKKSVKALVVALEIIALILVVLYFIERHVIIDII
tara:strand:+ start:618 stop:896 length:279 start_codon:yes stop_codon:yes gene_type:complete